ncbi:MAG: hypothetical protein GQ569_07945 [Methylococcaceae bacterium]|nr:hypothetical protein [Methylococcaceae bacterium]
MVFGGIISILIAIWIYRTAVQAKTGNTLYWVAGSVIVFLVVQTIMIYFNVMIIEIFDKDISDVYDNAGGLDSVNDSSAGIQSGTGGTLIGILFELTPFIASFFVIAVIRLMLMLKQPFAFMPLFGGVKETFIAIGESFKTSDQAAADAAPENNETKE